jgi:inhibitor of KinA
MEADQYKFTVKPYGQAAVLIEWPYQISSEISFQVQSLYHFLNENRAHGILELVPAYQSLLVVFAPEKMKLNEVLELINTFKPGNQTQSYDITIWDIPVTYDLPEMADMKAVLDHTKLSYDSLISKHLDTIYDVNFIGFLPGFLYLSGMDESLQVPRKKTPDLVMPKGSVAIGGLQTGIYPEQSPGGWHRIGQTDIALFDPYQAPYCKIKPGDKVKFIQA